MPVVTETVKPGKAKVKFETDEEQDAKKGKLPTGKLVKKVNKMKNSIIIEIRAAEGGDDSKLLVTDLANIYLKSARNNDFSYKIMSDISGFTSL